ncbi:MAG: hypothetical protein ACI82F_004429, partial [Planctomycetota bacterium]
PPRTEPEQEPRSELALELAQVAIFAMNMEGEPLVEDLRGQELTLLGVEVSRDPFGATLPGDSDPNGDLDPERGLSRIVGTWFGSRVSGLVQTRELLVDPPLWVALTLGRRVLATQTIQAGQERVEFRIEPESIRRHFSSLEFQIIDGPTGTPIVDAKVAAKLDQGTWLRNPGEPSDNGSYVLSPWPTGPTVIAISSEEAGWTLFDFEILPGSRTDAGSVSLWPMPLLEGHLLDEEGKRIRGVAFAIAAEPLAELPPPQNFEYALGSRRDITSGYFSLRLAPGTWQVSARAADSGVRPGFTFPFRQVTITRDGAPARLTLQLVPAAPMILEASAPWARQASFRVLLPDGARVREGDLIEDPTWRSMLPPGPYGIELVGPGDEVIGWVEIDHTESGTRLELDQL